MGTSFEASSAGVFRAGTFGIERGGAAAETPGSDAVDDMADVLDAGWADKLEDPVSLVVERARVALLLWPTQPQDCWRGEDVAQPLSVGCLG